MANEKMTKSEVLELIKETCADNETIVAYCDNELALIAKKAVKAKERAAAKRVEGDELRDCIEDLLTTEPQTAEDLLAQIEDESGELTKAKITSRVSQLVRLGRATKVEVAVDGKKRMHYTLPVEDEAEG